METGAGRERDRDTGKSANTASRVPEDAQFNRIREDEDRQATTYQSPDAGQMQAHLNVRAAAQAYLEAILVNVPQSGDREQAVQSVRVSLFFSNAAIALRGRV